jgi:hypothetical protein
MFVATHLALNRQDEAANEHLTGCEHASVIGGDLQSVSGRKLQPAPCDSQAQPVQFAKAALPLHRHSGKPARFEFTRHVRLQADTGFRPFVLPNPVSQCESQKGNYRLSAEEGMRLSKLKEMRLSKQMAYMCLRN